MRTKEITVSLSGVIPVAAYENLRPGYSMTVELENNEKPDDAFNYCQNYLRQMFDMEANRAKSDLIEKQYANIRFYEKDGKKYPSVTSILGWNIDWKVEPDHLKKLAARGTIVHKLIEHYLTNRKWPNPLEMPSLQEEVAILEGNTMWWECCSHIEFMKQFGDKIVPDKLEDEVYNDANLYAGTLDLRGFYEGKKSLLDFKSGTVYDFRQLAAYAVCLDDIEQLVICPVGQTDNKCGYMKPKVCTTIQDEFKEFLKARAKFKQRFGI